MTWLFHLSGSHPDMALAEIKALFGSKNIKVFSSQLVAIMAPLNLPSCSTSARSTSPHSQELFLLPQKQYPVLGKRLAYTKAGYSLLFVCINKSLIRRIRSFNWSAVVIPPLAVQFAGGVHLEKDTSSEILSLLKNPSVNLENPRTFIEFFHAGDLVLCGIKKWENAGGFNQRRSHLLPAPHPSGMHPKLARWMVNMTGAAGKRVIVDPFCGAGGLLVEAGLMGLKPVGFDILPSMIRRAAENLKSFNISCRLKVQDALSLEGSLPFVVTDLPYGKTTFAGPRNDLAGLYQAFIRVLEMTLTCRAVVGYPEGVDLPSLISSKKLVVKGSFSYYIHRSLTKKILVLEPCKK